MSAEEAMYDVLIVGGGPAGCTAALYAARGGLRTAILSPAELSGMMAKAPIVGNFPAQVEPLPGKEILALIRQQALNAGAEHLIEPALAVDFTDEEKRLVYGGGGVHAALTVIIATGAMAPQEKVAGEDKFQGLGVCYCTACDGPLYAGRDVLVVGGDEQAAEEALALAGIAKSVVLIVPQAELELEAEMQKAVEANDAIRVACGLSILEIIGDQFVQGATFRDRHGAQQHIPADGVFLYLRGTAPATDFLEGALETDDQGFIVTDELCQTSVSGVFAAGDVRKKQVSQMVVAAADGATAALAAERFIRKRITVSRDRGRAKE